MKIAVNTRLLLQGKLEGIGWFTYETLKRITQAHPEHHFYFIFDRPYSDEFLFGENVTPVVVYPPTRHPFLWYIYFEYTLPRVLKKIKPDLFLSPDGWVSLSTSIKTVDVIHDLNFEHHPEFIKPLVRKYYLRFFHRFAAKSVRIATVSEFTKQDIHQLYHIPLEKIDVVYNGSNQAFQPLPEADKIIVRDDYSQGTSFFLFVGLIHKRKNIDNIFRAFDAFKEEVGGETKLVVVGEKKWWKGELEDAFLAMKHQDDVIFLGRQPSDILAKLMSSATALLYPSIFEGFGIPILEAFHAETAVITSNTTSMPEVAGDAAILVDPYSVQEIKEAMTCIASDDKLREILIEKGRIQRQKFSWDSTAKRLWETINIALSER